MSTKIYNAYALPEGSDVFTLAQQLHPRLAAIVRDMQLRLIADSLVRIRDLDTLDSLSMGLHVKADCPLWLLAQRDETFPLDRIGRPEELDCQLVLLRDPKTHRLYTKTFASANLSQALANLADELGWADFSYWDNTEGPDDVTEAEWNEREQTWDRILAPGDFIPAACGPVIDATPTADWRRGSPSRLIEADATTLETIELPTPYERARSLLREVIPDVMMTVLTPDTLPEFLEIDRRVAAADLDPIIEFIRPVAIEDLAEADPEPFHDITLDDAKHLLRTILEED